MVLAREIRTYSFTPPLLGEEEVPGLNLVLKQMLNTDRGSRYRDAVEVLAGIEWVAREQNEILCRELMEQRVVPAMRDLFLRHWMQKEGSQWEDTPEYGQLYLEREKKVNRKAANWLIKEKLASGNSGSWDATALCTILLWSNVHPLMADEAPEDHADVSRFREWRNELVHRVVWDSDQAAQRAAVMWAFIERHTPSI